MLLFDKEVGQGETNANDCTCEFFFVGERVDEQPSDIISGKLADVM